MHGRYAAVAVAVLGLWGWAVPAGAEVLFARPVLDLNGSEPVSTGVTADDFFVNTPGTLRSAQVYLVDSSHDDNGVLDDFSGTLSWALYEGAGFGQPEGAAIATGSASGFDLMQTDTGQQDAFGADIVAVHFNITPFVLEINNLYWLAIHEGEWLSEQDATPVWWSRGATPFASPSHSDLTETNPGVWESNDVDVAFVLYDTSIPEPGGAAALATLAVAGLARRRRTGSPSPR